MSTELVGRGIGPSHNANVPFHGYELTPHQAEAINGSVEIVIYGYRHREVHNVETSTEVDYESMRQIIAGLDPLKGDVLFVENFEHEGMVRYESEERYTPDELEQLAASSAITPQQYLEESARHKGIPMVVADMSAHMVEQLADVVGSSVSHLYGGLFMAEGDADIVHSLREEQAANTVKDYALETLPDLHQRKIEGQRKPIYAVAWGYDHVDGVRLRSKEGRKSNGLGVAFRRLHLNSRSVLMPNGHPVQGSVENQKAG